MRAVRAERFPSRATALSSAGTSSGTRGANMSIIEQGSWRSRLGGLAATAILVVPCAAVAARASSAARAAQGQELVTYVRVGDKNTSAYNLADAQAVAVLDIAPQTVLAVHGERNGWLDVEAPGGFQVWVWGEYLEETDEPGVLR